MSYQVLARKYRPRSFADMAGQEHVLRALINGLENDRLHHAYLFTGTRGVGKTTVARVLAKCLNCETGVTSEPCGTCSACTSIDEGRFVDLIEVDAASRTRVEDTRELLDNVQYAPTHGRYKIYLVDEVHMLSTHSFNALLKTLEEPPPHVKFLLATTDPQKVPVTILSRCLQFNLKRLPASLIADYLGRVLQQEGITAEAPGLARLARAADGSMRDALSLTDQALAFGGGQVTDDDVRGMLGSIEDHSVLDIIEALAGQDGDGLMGVVDQLAERSPDFADVLAAILTNLHLIGLLQTVPRSVDADHPDHGRLQALSGALTPEDVQLFYQIALTGRRDLPLAPEPRMGFEMVLLRMLAFRPDDGSAPPAAGSGPASGRTTGQQRGATESAGPTPAVSAAKEPAEGAPEPAAEHGVDPADAANAAIADAPAAPTAEPGAPVRADALPPWHELVPHLTLSGMAQALAMQCRWGGYADGVVTLCLDQRHRSLRNKQVEQRIESALSSHLGGAVTVRFQMERTDAEEDALEQTPAERVEVARRRRQEAAEEAIREDPTIADMQQRFGAEVLPDSIQPAE
ncbi:DNA polymerase III subunit gamma/tau [Aquisalimonas sp.]|uniref:DNA polymerase III subunit gamma/tau n=1 Tax=unclassified Aquisalimonas TaxID=2644645 RepID=UPI0025BF2AC3|nr:DNA polymerase III subunit gamma/tau [Aquisalimonas sp.]